MGNPDNLLEERVGDGAPENCFFSYPFEEILTKEKEVSVEESGLCQVDGGRGEGFPKPFIDEGPEAEDGQVGEGYEYGGYLLDVAMLLFCVVA